MRLTLLIPELLWSEPGDKEANAPATRSEFAKILAARHFVRQTSEGWELSLLRLAGLQAESSLAVLRAVGDGLLVDPSPADARRWLCADPVHLRFHQNRLILADAQELSLTPDDLAGLATRLNHALAGRAEFFFRGTMRGYAKLASPPEKVAVAGQTLSRKIGCEVRPGDFGGDAEIRGLANEIQMLLHADPLNRAREATGQPALNALWLWGAGEAPRRTALAEPLVAIAGQHPLIAGIAAALTIPQVDPADLARCSLRHALYLIDGLSTPTHYQDIDGFARAWEAIDRTHLAPNLDALRRWRWKKIDVVAPVVFGELRWQLSPIDAWLGRLARRRWPDLLTELTTQAPSGKTRP